MTDVVLVRWPEEWDRLERLRASGIPRLLLIGEEVAAPEPFDTLEDWIRLPAADGDLRVRADTLAARAENSVVPPGIDEDGVVRFGGRWIAVSPVERTLAIALIDNFCAVVRRDTLGRAAWPGGGSTRNALDVHMLRLRRRLLVVGLEVQTVRARGYLLQPLKHYGVG